jgi:hypothetical protein
LLHDCYMIPRSSLPLSQELPIFKCAAQSIYS